MSVTVTFKSEKALGRNYTLLDSFENVKKASKGLEEMFNALDKLEEKHTKEDETTPLYEYGRVINEYTIKNVATLIGLSSKDAKRLEKMSRSDVSDFYSELIDKFCQMTVPSVKAMNDYMQALMQANSDTSDTEEKDSTDPK